MRRKIFVMLATSIFDISLAVEKQNMELAKKIKNLMKNLEEAKSKLAFEMKKVDELELSKLNSISMFALLEEEKANKRDSVIKKYKDLQDSNAKLENNMFLRMIWMNLIWHFNEWMQGKSKLMKS